MAAPFTPTVKVGVGFGYDPLADPTVYTDLTSFNPQNIMISRGRPSELDSYKPAVASLDLMMADRDLDPSNLSGTHVSTVDVSRFPVASTAGTATEIGTSLGTDNAISLPSNVQVGDLLIAVASVLNASTDTTTGTGSATWTTLHSTASTGNDVRQTVFARIATGSDDLVLSGASDDYVVSVMRIIRHGCSSVADIEIANTSGTSGNVDPPTLDAGATKRWLWLAVGSADFTSIEFSFREAPPTYTTIVATESSTVADSVGQCIGARQLEIDEEDPDAFNHAGSGYDWVAATLAIPPVVVTEDRTDITPNTPLRIVAALPSRELVVDDDCSGPRLHSVWTVEEGYIATTLSGTLELGIADTTVEMRSRSFNFDDDAEFMFGISDDGSSPNAVMRIEMPNNPTPSYIGFRITPDSGKVLTWFVDDGNEAGTLVSSNEAWSDTNHRYLRIVIDGNDVIFQRSADASTWTTLDTYTRGSDFSSAVDWSAVKILVGVYDDPIDFSDFRIYCSNFTRFVGSVDSWEFTPYPGNSAGMVRIVATDNLKVLANDTLETPYSKELAALAPDGWWKLDDRGAVASDSSGNGLDGSIPVGVVQTGVDPAVPLLGGSGIQFPTLTRNAGVRLPDSARRTAVPYTVNAWISGDKLPDDGTLGSAWLALQAIYTQGEVDNDDWLIAFGIQAFSTDDDDAIDQWCVAVYATEDNAPGPSGGKWRFENDGLPHMITVVVDALSSYTVYVDGVEAENLSYNTLGFTGSFIGHYVGRGNIPSTAAGGYSWPGTIDEVSVHSEALTESEVRALYEAGANPWELDGTKARVERLLDLAGWSDRLRTLDRGTMAMSAFDQAGDPIIRSLDDVIEVEGGRYYIDFCGDMVFHDYARVSSRTNNPLVFDDNDAGVDILGDGFVMTVDDRRLFTAALINEQFYEDTVASVRYGRRVYSNTGNFAYERLAYIRAVSIVERYKLPQVKLGRIVVAPEKTPAQWADMLNMRLGDTMNVTFTLLNTGDTFDEMMICEEISERIMNGAWTFTLLAGAEDSRYGTTFQFDGSSGDRGFDMGVWL